jgi:hypothetical protein
MQAASVVEGILCRVTTRDRATAIVGDLVETKQHNGTVRFWLSAAGVVLSLVWRWPVAFVASFYAGAWTFEAFLMATYGVNAHRPSGYLWGQVIEGVSLMGSSAIALSVFAAIRDGVRERTTQMVLSWATVAAAVIYFWWVPAVLVACCAGVAALIVYSVFAREGRQASVVVWAAIVVGVSGFFFWTGLGTLYQHWLKPGLWGSDDVQQHPSASWIAFGLMLVAHLGRVWVWSRMRGWVAVERRVDARSEML